MAMSNRRNLLLSFGVLTVLLLTGCKQSTVYFHFENTPESGWEKSDAIVFNTEKLSADALCQEDLALRISGKYPFMRLTLIVEQTVFPAGKTMIDTLDCNLIDERGNAQGGGVSQYQFQFSIRKLQLHQGDSLQLSVHHDMKREILPGITSIGVRVKKGE